MSTIKHAFTDKKRLDLIPLGSGGEGEVYEIAGYPNKVAKIYYNEPADKRALREEKIKAMVSIGQSSSFRMANLDNSIAWPLSPLYDGYGHFIGFGMNRIAVSTELDDLYVYPPTNNVKASIKDKVKCLISLCEVIESLHQTGQVFGDFNPNNIKINQNWSVSFVDADSYHVNTNGKEYKCVVCAPGYVAPELIHKCKGKPYAECQGETFTKETDYFALAIHIFRMIMNGCHPFICERQLKRAGSTPAPKSTDKRVENGETPFFKAIPNYCSPQYAPDIKALPPYLYDLFKRAFVDGHSDPKLRPTAFEWKSALILFQTELKKCNNNPMHFYWKDIVTCPYCEADNRYKMKTGMIPIASRVNSQRNHITTNSNTGKYGGSYYSGNVYSQKSNTSVLNGASNICKGSTKSPLFWTITLLFTVIIESLIGIYVLPAIFGADNSITPFCVLGCVISGIIGCITYNSKWAYDTSKAEWIYSILTALGFTFLFGVALFLLVVIVQILIHIIAAIIIIAIIIGILSGG